MFALIIFKNQNKDVCCSSLGQPWARTASSTKHIRTLACDNLLLSQQTNARHSSRQRIVKQNNNKPISAMQQNETILCAPSMYLRQFSLIVLLTPHKRNEKHAPLQRHWNRFCSAACYKNRGKTFLFISFAVRRENVVHKAAKRKQTAKEILVYIELSREQLVDTLTNFVYFLVSFFIFVFRNWKSEKQIFGLRAKQFYEFLLRRLLQFVGVCASSRWCRENLFSFFPNRFLPSMVNGTWVRLRCLFERIRKSVSRTTWKIKCELFIFYSPIRNRIWV